ncbi:MAG: undecaprenyldiphospho-muramoylpentapeptide beta-N-acetylglucosaminyltransferase [Pseudolabrys sp.]|nr:undecaprenyldiphospho-muramoylpentapeptide beta-N-acetylglucosaminyltransferase [Pseudolabrys sp.]
MVAAGGTGGHLFPAEALAVALRNRGTQVELATDHRAAGYGGEFTADKTHLIPSATLRGGGPLAYARTLSTLTIGLAKAWLLLGRLRPAVVVGFGGYPTVPPLFAAAMRGIPTVLHEQNGVMGRANSLLAARVTKIATGFAEVKMLDAFKSKQTVVGTPVRPNVVAAAATSYAAPDPKDELRILVFGGSQGARVMGDIVPEAIEQLASDFGPRLRVTQQARGEDLARVTTIYRNAKIAAEVAPFFNDLPARMAKAHLVISRSGASTVAELAAIGRPAILVPLPHALDQDQLANASVLEKAGGALLIQQDGFTPERVASELADLLSDPARLARMAQGAKSVGTLDAADRLAELVLKIAGERG